MTSEVELLYTQTIMRILNGFSDIASFRQVSAWGISGAATKSFSVNLEAISELKHLKAFALLTDPAGPFLSSVGGINSFAAKMVDKQLRTFQSAVDSASIVFAHSILDDVAHNICRVVGMLCPSAWHESLKLTKVSLGDLKSSTYEVLLQGKVAERIEKLRMATLLEKADLIFATCPPVQDKVSIQDFQYDRERLEALDAVRHGVVHRNETTAANAIDDDISYLRRTALYLFNLPNSRFDIRIDPSVLALPRKPG